MNLKVSAPRFNLRHTLESGQFFRWTREGDYYFVQRGLRYFRVHQAGTALEVMGSDRWFVRDLFALDHDFKMIEESLRRDRKLRPALNAYAGLRIIRQDPWECTAAFLLSIASNIPRITGHVEDIARMWGKSSRLGTRSTKSFPRPDKLGDERELRELRTGFRAPYLMHAARLAQCGLLEEVSLLPDFEARETLMVIPGVAEKVADCILLFAFGRLAGCVPDRRLDPPGDARHVLRWAASPRPRNPGFRVGAVGRPGRVCPAVSLHLVAGKEARPQGTSGGRVPSVTRIVIFSPSRVSSNSSTSSTK